MSERVDALVGKLEKGMGKTAAMLGGLEAVQWQQVVYAEPYPWTVRDLLAHFYSSEESLLGLVQEVAAGGAGAPEGFDYNAFNAKEQKRLAAWTPADLLAALGAARGRTVLWVRTLQEADLDNFGRHPALGEVTVEVMITAIYGHQLLHMRDLMAVLGG
jgi:hypothetical protein